MIPLLIMRHNLIASSMMNSKPSYTEVEYLERGDIGGSMGNYINFTNIVYLNTNQNCNITIKFKITDDSSYSRSGDRLKILAYSSIDSLNLFYRKYKSGTVPITLFISGSDPSDSSNVKEAGTGKEYNLNEMIEVSISVYSGDNEYYKATIKQGSSTLETSPDFRIRGTDYVNLFDNYDLNKGIRVYSLTQTNEGIKKIFVPAKKTGTDIYGLYEKTEKKFYLPTGAGTIIGGPEIGEITE